MYNACNTGERAERTRAERRLPSLEAIAEQRIVRGLIPVLVALAIALVVGGVGGRILVSLAPTTILTPGEP